MLDEQFWRKYFEEFVKESKRLYANCGITYYIPKEQQLRSLLYARLREEGALVELESNIKEKAQKRYGAPMRFDLRIVDTVDVLIEVKRTTALDFWLNDNQNYLRAWKEDVDKLVHLKDRNYERMAISEKTRKCFILMVFKNSEKHWKKLQAKIEEFSQYVGKNFESVLPFESDVALLTKRVDGFSEEKIIEAKMYVWIEK